MNKTSRFKVIENSKIFETLIRAQYMYQSFAESKIEKAIRTFSHLSHISRNDEEWYYSAYQGLSWNCKEINDIELLTRSNV